MSESVRLAQFLRLLRHKRKGQARVSARRLAANAVLDGIPLGRRLAQRGFVLGALFADVGKLVERREGQVEELR